MSRPDDLAGRPEQPGQPADGAHPVDAGHPAEARQRVDAGHPVDASDGNPPRRIGLVLAVAATVLAADQLSKWWALSALADGPVHVLGPLWLRLTYNTAGAFGLGGGLVPFLSLIALGVVIYLIVSGVAGGRLAAALATGLLLGGAVGNLADRLARSPGLLRGAVVDFLDLGFWPVFNVADMAITCGCLMLVLWPGRHRDR